MRWLIVACLLLVGPVIRAADPDDAHYSKPGVRKELVAAIDAQLAAFRASDFAGAYKLAAEPLRLQFTLKQFTAMVTRTYPLIAHNQRAEFGLPMDDGVNATLTVRVYGASGKFAVYRYVLAREAAAWRISGVLPESAPGPDA
jgi:hypothetical protein